MKSIKLLLSILLLITVVFTAQSQQLEIPLGGNAYSSQPYARGSRISTKGIRNWTNPNEYFTVYFRLPKSGNIQLGLNGLNVKAEAALNIGVGGKYKKIHLKIGDTAINAGQWKIKDSGYLAVEIRGLSSTDGRFPDIQNLVLGGSLANSQVVYVKDNSDNLFYFGRRGPSTHLNYSLPKAIDVEWFYNELTVPLGQDPIGSYFMANGFAEGYFGIQVNSASERRILFSVWSPFTTDNPKEIPADKKILLVNKGENVRTGEFGGEGSGGQSYKIYDWKAGQTYRFLLRVRPIANNYTEYTAYFSPANEENWQLIACFQRPYTHTYAKRLHSFLECFNPAMGNITRSGYYGNQWVCDTTGNWHELSKARFTYDNTAAKGYRKDYQGGLSKEGTFYLKIDGFFNEFTPYNTQFERPLNRVAPKIDFSKLP